MLQPGLRALFPFENGVTYLNHGGFGVTPNDVTAARLRHLQMIDRCPNKFLSNECRPRWREIAGQVARRFGAQAEDIALISGTTEGINGILRSLSFAAGDEILVTSLAYGSIAKAATHIAAQRGATVVTAELQFPNPSPEQCLSAIARALTPRTKLAILDHITSSTALVLPIKEMTALCHERGVPVLADGAHVPGQLALNIPAIDADWYVANLHKWYFVPRSCGFLWRSPTRQKAQNLWPAVLSWDIGEEFPHSFAWTGTQDDSRWLSIPDAFAFMDRFGEAAVRQHNHALLREAVSLLADAWNARGQTPDAMTGSMTLIPLPDNLPYASDEDGRKRLRAELQSRNIFIEPCFAHQGRIWGRIAAQIYNEIGEYAHLADILPRL